mmetsp:Transcript_89734/g.158842  ORF Transcript_89734/g.158842 Transcript_89734/m.158842 type:complete len:1291 (-) Transcript_89734:181-4053(-)
MADCVQATTLAEVESQAEPHLSEVDFDLDELEDPFEFTEDTADVPSGSAFDALPKLRETPSAERAALFRKKLQVCCQVFDFRDDSNSDEKEAKRLTLQEFVDDPLITRSCFAESSMQDVMSMVSANIFRASQKKDRSAASSSRSYWDEETGVHLGLVIEIPERAWVHLGLVYKFFFQLVDSNEFVIRLRDSHVDGGFIRRLLQLFNSEDSRERQYLKRILQRVYERCAPFNSFIIISLCDCLRGSGLEVHNGVAELLEVLGSIIKDSQRNSSNNLLKAELKSVTNVLLPLQKLKTLAKFHKQLSNCLASCVEIDPSLAQVVIGSLLPFTASLQNSRRRRTWLAKVPWRRDVLAAASSNSFSVCAGAEYASDPINVLMAMGFSQKRSREALAQCSTIEDAVRYMTERPAPAMQAVCHNVESDAESAATVPERDEARERSEHHPAAATTSGHQPGAPSCGGNHNGDHDKEDDAGVPSGARERSEHHPAAAPTAAASSTFQPASSASWCMQEAQHEEAISDRGAEPSVHEETEKEVQPPEEESPWRNWLTEEVDAELDKLEFWACKEQVDPEEQEEASNRAQKRAEPAERATDEDIQEITNESKGQSSNVTVMLPTSHDSMASPLAALCNGRPLTNGFESAAAAKCSGEKSEDTLMSPGTFTPVTPPKLAARAGSSQTKAVSMTPFRTGICEAPKSSSEMLSKISEPPAGKPRPTCAPGIVSGKRSWVQNIQADLPYVGLKKPARPAGPTNEAQVAVPEDHGRAAKSPKSEASSKSAACSKSEAVPAHLLRDALIDQCGLTLSDFDPRFDVAYSHSTVSTRGSERYFIPSAGWQKLGLRVEHRHEDRDWLHREKWPVIYHGTSASRGVVCSILNEGFKIRGGQAHAQHGEHHGTGIYCSPITEKAMQYADQPLMVNEVPYTLVFQCRVRPSRYVKPEAHVWLVENPDDIRPCGILLRKSWLRDDQEIRYRQKNPYPSSSKQGRWYEETLRHAQTVREARLLGRSAVHLQKDFLSGHLTLKGSEFKDVKYHYRQAKRKIVGKFAVRSRQHHLKLKLIPGTLLDVLRRLRTCPSREGNLKSKEDHQTKKEVPDKGKDARDKMNLKKERKEKSLHKKDRKERREKDKQEGKEKKEGKEGKERREKKHKKEKEERDERKRKDRKEKKAKKEKRQKLDHVHSDHGSSCTVAANPGRGSDDAGPADLWQNASASASSADGATSAAAGASQLMGTTALQQQAMQKAIHDEESLFGLEAALEDDVNAPQAVADAEALPARDDPYTKRSIFQQLLAEADNIN